MDFNSSNKYSLLLGTIITNTEDISLTLTTLQASSETLLHLLIKLDRVYELKKVQRFIVRLIFDLN